MIETNSDVFTNLMSIDASDAGVLNLAPGADWSEMRQVDHFVQFYETDEFLLNSVSGFLGAGLSAGAAAIMVGTKSHRDSLELALQKQGLNAAYHFGDAGRAARQGTDRSLSC